MSPLHDLQFPTKSLQGRFLMLCAIKGHLRKKERKKRKKKKKFASYNQINTVLVCHVSLAKTP
jgi:hypothetical protein